MGVERVRPKVEKEEREGRGGRVVSGRDRPEARGRRGSTVLRYDTYDA